MEEIKLNIPPRFLGVHSIERREQNLKNNKMKNTILGALIGISIMLCIKATDETKFTQHPPAKPKKWLSIYGSESHVSNVITNYSNIGYIVHELEYSGYGNTAFVVMYKY